MLNVANQIKALDAAISALRGGDIDSAMSYVNVMVTNVAQFDRRHDGRGVLPGDGILYATPDSIACAMAGTIGRPCAHVAEYGEHAWTTDLDGWTHCVECGAAERPAKLVDPGFQIDRDPGLTVRVLRAHVLATGGDGVVVGTPCVVTNDMFTGLVGYVHEIDEYDNVIVRQGTPEKWAGR